MEPKHKPDCSGHNQYQTCPVCEKHTLRFDAFRQAWVCACGYTTEYQEPNRDERDLWEGFNR